MPDEFSSAEEAGEFWDTHSGADYEDYMKEVRFDVDLKGRTHDVRIADDLMRQLPGVAALDRDPHLAGVEAARPEDVVHDPREPVRLARDHVEQPVAL